jgi:hypothetical protein
MSDRNRRGDPNYRDTATYKDRYAARGSRISGAWTIAGLVAIALMIGGIVYSYSAGGTNLSSRTVPVVGMNSPALGLTTGAASPASPHGDVLPDMQRVSLVPAK